MVKYLKFRRISGKKIKSSSQFKAMVGKSDFQVVFTKADGTERTMNASTNTKRMPQFLKPKGTVQNRTPKEDVVTVLDTDEMSWKSFKVERLKEVIFCEGR